MKIDCKLFLYICFVTWIINILLLWKKFSNLRQKIPSVLFDALSTNSKFYQNDTNYTEDLYYENSEQSEIFTQRESVEGEDALLITVNNENSKKIRLYHVEDEKFISWIFTKKYSFHDKIIYFNNFLSIQREKLKALSGIQQNDWREELFETTVYDERLQCPKEALQKTYTVVRGLNQTNFNFQFTSKGLTSTYFLSWRDDKNSKITMEDIIDRLPMHKFYHCVKGLELVQKFENYSTLQMYLSQSLCKYDCSSDWENLKVPRAPLDMLFYTYTLYTYTKSCQDVLKNQFDTHFEILHSVDIIHNGIVERNGCVIKDNQWIESFTFNVEKIGKEEILECHENNNTYVHVKEIFVSTQRPVSKHSSLNFAHVLSEMLTKVTPFYKFLKDNPEVYIHVPVMESFVPKLYSVFGLKNQLLDGTVLADTIYLPHGSGFNDLFISTSTASHLFFENKLQELFGEKAELWDSILFIKRRNRQINNFTIITEHLQSLCSYHGYRFYVFDDQQLPSFEDTMLEFHRARLIIGPHGAGLANLIFAQPGTVVMEIMCTPYWPRTTFSNIALKKGLRYYVTVTTKGKNNRRCNKDGLLLNMNEFKNITNYIFESIFPIQ